MFDFLFILVNSGLKCNLKDGATKMSDKKYNYDRLLKICMDDRFRAMKRLNVHISKIKILNIDLVVKLLILYINSFGKRTKKKIAFIDEVRNISMINNLYNTIIHCPNEFSIIRLRDKHNDKKNLKVGYCWPLVQLVIVLIKTVGMLIASPFFGMNNTSNMLIKAMEKYLKRINEQGYKTIYSMTDHNFFSTICCAFPGIYSNVIQHGIILDVTYFSPITTDRFLAWGNHSKQILNDPRVIVTGTYKFENIKKSKTKDDNCVLFCISSTDKELLKKKIRSLIHICKLLNFRLKVLNHPGSYFDNLGLEKLFPSVEIIKEIPVDKLDFSIAVIENSTILIDLIYMNKPYVIYDDLLEYFNQYSIPASNDFEKIYKSIKNYRTIDYNSINDKIIEQELNNNECSIFI